jgi:hypothetical protein
MQLILDAKQMGECLDLWRETLEARFEDEDVRGAGADRLAALNKLLEEIKTLRSSGPQ